MKDFGLKERPFNVQSAVEIRCGGGVLVYVRVVASGRRAGRLAIKRLVAGAAERLAGAHRIASPAG